GLTPREAKVLRMRFGIDMNTDHTLEEVGKQFDVTRERIRQIEAKALRKLRHPSRSEQLRSFLDIDRRPPPPAKDHDAPVPCAGASCFARPATHPAPRGGGASAASDATGATPTRIPGPSPHRRFSTRWPQWRGFRPEAERDGGRCREIRAARTRLRADWPPTAHRAPGTGDPMNIAKTLLALSLAAGLAACSNTDQAANSAQEAADSAAEAQQAAANAAATGDVVAAEAAQTAAEAADAAADASAQIAGQVQGADERTGRG